MKNENIAIIREAVSGECRRRLASGPVRGGSGILWQILVMIRAVQAARLPWATEEGEMGPLQYIVVGYEREHFRDDVLPELTNLSKRNVIRMLDVLIVRRNEDGVVSSVELAELLPDERDLLTEPDHDEWITQDDVDVVGENMPCGSSVALLFFEHTWANRLENLVLHANQFLGDDATTFPGVAAEIEQMLAAGIRTHAG